jgi:nucleoside transporter
MKMAAAASLLLGLYSFTLPNTPPQNVGRNVSAGEVLGLKTLKLLKDRAFFVFVLCSLLISIPLAFYYNFTNLFLNEGLGMQGVAGKMTMGQMSEVIFMILMPWFFVRLGVKKMLLVGMLAWVARYALFANGNLGANEWMIYAGILLHGICYDFFFVTGQIYVDKKAPAEMRASAQGFIALITYGIGIGLGSILSGKVVDAFTVDGAKDWTAIWWVPCALAAAIALFFAVTFKDRAVSKQHAADIQAAVKEA